MSESWITLSEDDVFAATNVERLMVVNIKKVDDLQEICDRVTAQVRHAYEFSGRTMGANGTIPEGLKARAVALALWLFISGLQGIEKIQTKEREAAGREAREYFEKISSGEVGNISGPSVGRRRRKFTGREEDGI
jgi:hypothetical protein